MAYPHRVARITFSGDCWNGTEIWSTGFFMGFPGGDAPEITQAGIDQIGAAWKTFFSTNTTAIASTYKFTAAKAVMLNNDGKSLPETAKYHYPAAPVAGANGVTRMPAQISLVATLTNTLPRGLATKGRMFLPGIASSVTDTGKISQPVAAAIATNLKLFFDTVYSDADTPGNPVLASLGSGPLQLGGVIRPVTGIKIGDVWDTQRRRRNQFTELYEQRVVATGA